MLRVVTPEQIAITGFRGLPQTELGSAGGQHLYAAVGEEGQVPSFVKVAREASIASS